MTTLASELALSHAWEDPTLAAAVVARVGQQLGRPLRVLTVASGGQAALALLALPAVGRLDVVDASRAQLRLTALRLAALLQLSSEDQLALFGSLPGGEPSSRLRLYKRVQGQLDAKAREFWDARSAEVGHGLSRLGRFQALIARLAEGFKARGLDPVARPAEALTHKAWPTIFAEAFDPASVEQALGPAAVAYACEPLAKHLATACADAMLKHDARTNPYLHVLLSGYLPEGVVPDYMQGKAAIQELGPQRLRLHEGRLGAQLNILTATGPFDVIDTGCESDWMPLEGVRHFFLRAAEALAPGGAIVARRFNGDYDLHAQLSAALPVDAELPVQDRSILFRELAVAYKPRG